MESKISLLLMTFMVMIFQCDTCPKECSCFETMADCYSRHLQAIPDGLSESVTSVDLSDNEIANVDTDKLSKLQNLQILMLHLNSLRQLKPYAFANLTRLEKLHIGNNRIETIGDDAFTDLPLLRDLDLTKNMISEITGKFNLPNIRRLTLSFNQITSLQDNTLNGVRNVTQLILSDNKITYISKSAFDGMTYLAKLVLCGNPIKNIDNIFHNVGTMSYLDVSYCQLTKFPKNLPWALRQLVISNNNLTILESQDLRGTLYLGVLILDNNQIQVVQDGAFLYTPYLQLINISNNKLTHLPEIPKNVETFNANSNEIQKIFQSNFAHDSALKILSLSNNKISDIPAYAFLRLGNLSELQLNQNSIKDIKNMTFSGLRQVITLNLDFNPIEKIEYRAFAGLQKLENLILSNADSNHTITEGIIFQDVPSLQSLDLQGSPSIVSNIQQSSDLLRSLRNTEQLNLVNTSLKTLPIEIKTSLPHLKSLQLSGNPWHCDAELVELHKWIHDSPQMFKDSTIMCMSPTHLKGRLLQDVSVNELTEPVAPVSSNLPVQSASTITAYPNEGLNETSEITGVRPTDSYLLFSTGMAATKTTALLSEVSHKDSSLPTSFQATFTIFNHFQTDQTSVTAPSANFAPKNTLTAPLPTTSAHLYPASTMLVSPTKSVILSEVSQTLIPSKPSYENASPNLSPTASERLMFIYSSPAPQIPTTSLDRDKTGPTTYTSRDSPGKSIFSVMPTTAHLTTIIQPTPTIISQPISQNIKTALKLSIPSTDITSTILLDITSPSLVANLYHTSTLATSITTPQIKHHTRFSPIQDTQMTGQFSATGLLILSSSTLATSGRFLETTFPNLIESTAVQDSVHKTMEDHSLPTTDNDFEEQHKSYPAKPVIDNRLPTFTKSVDTKLRATIIVVSVSLLALVVGLFIIVAIVKYRKKRKRVSFAIPSKHETVFQNETSDTVFILSHMEGEQTGNSNTQISDDTIKDGQSEDNSELKNNSQTSKSVKFNKQSMTPSAVISRTSFDCIRSQEVEDDSELLMDSWK